MPEPRVSLTSLDTLWFQVAGTVCNLACTHCLVSSSPTNRTHEPMGLGQIRGLLGLLVLHQQRVASAGPAWEKAETVTYLAVL